MNLLAIDTATEACSAALWVDGKLFHRSTVQPRLHAELILPFIDELLLEAKVHKSDIQGLIVGQGPGAFTGVRIGVGVAQGLALGLNLPIVAVSSLQTLAYQAYVQLKTQTNKTIVVATDARMNEIYSARYTITNKKITELSKEIVGKANQIDLKNVDAHIGSGFVVYPELVEYNNNNKMGYEVNQYSHAKYMLLMVKDKFNELKNSLKKIEPVYLREP